MADVGVIEAIPNPWSTTELAQHAFFIAIERVGHMELLHRLYGLNPASPCAPKRAVDATALLTGGSAVHVHALDASNDSKAYRVAR